LVRRNDFDWEAVLEKLERFMKELEDRSRGLPEKRRALNHYLCEGSSLLSKDQCVGVLLLIGGVLGIVLYGWLVFLTEWSMLMLQLTGFIAVAAILSILSWIEYTLASTPPPKPLEEPDAKELEEEES